MAAFRAGHTGALLAITLAAWALLSTPDAPGAVATAATVLLGVVAWVVGGLLTRWRPEAPGVAVAGVVAGLFLVSLPDSLTSSPTAGPLEYANANGALLTAGVAGLMHAAWNAPRARRTVLVVAAVLFTVAAVIIESRAAAVSCILLLLVGRNLGRSSRAVWQVMSTAILTVGLLGVVVLGLTHGDSGTDAVQQTVGTTRTALWSEALGMAADAPVRGIGAGTFAEQSRIAQDDPDLAWAHSEPLQIAAELGWLGLALALALVGWMLLAVGRGAPVLAVLCLQPMVDYTLHFPWVIAVTAATLGGIAFHGFSRGNPKDAAHRGTDQRDERPPT